MTLSIAQSPEIPIYCVSKTYRQERGLIGYCWNVQITFDCGLVALLDSRSVAHGADRRYAGVRVSVAGASHGGDQAAAAAFRASILAVHDGS